MRLSSALAALAFASSAVAIPHKRADGLSVDVSGPGPTVTSVDELKFTATVTNTGSESLKVLKYGTILDSLPTRSFSVIKDGSTVSFQGVKLNVDLNENAYTTIAGGEIITIEHDLSNLYDYASAGVGKFEFTPNTAFKVLGVSLSVVAEPIAVEVTDDVAQRDFGTPAESSDIANRLDKRSVVTCGNADEAAFISASYTEAKELASIASTYTSGGGPLVAAYFSTNPASSVTDILNAVANENDASRTLDCTDPFGACDGNIIAYTVIATTNIFYCDIFFQEVATPELCGSVTVDDRVIRGGTTLHELTHALAGTVDVTYGCPNDQALDAEDQISNADHFNCFTTQVYHDTKC